jgi:hypothetical protein
MGRVFSTFGFWVKKIVGKPEGNRTHGKSGKRSKKFKKWV